MRSVFFPNENQACLTTILLSQLTYFVNKKILQETKDKLKDPPVLEILLPHLPYKCIFYPNAKTKRNIFLEVLVANSCRWDYLLSRMQINMFA